MKRVFIYAVLTVIMCIGTAVYAEPMDKYKNFNDVFTESIGLSADDIGYGMICFPSEGINRAASLETDELKRLVELYKNAKGECVTAPFNTAFDSLSFNGYDNYPYFYIGLSASLPAERWTWSKNVKMLQLCFGGEYSGAAVYGGYGRIGSSYGEQYPDSMPRNFVWYKPVGDLSEEIQEIGMELYDKYKETAKPFGDYEGTGDEKYFSGFDGTWETKLTLPICFTADGCSKWAYDILQNAASDGLIPYTFGGAYTEPITRREFCDLAANILNMTPQREYADLFNNPSGYTVLSEKIEEMGTETQSIEYSDVEPNTESVKYLSALKIVEGVGGNKFDPDGFITREQVCTILMRMFSIYPEFETALSANEQTSNIYSDDDTISEWAREGVYAMTEYGIVNGMGDGSFSPRESLSREQAVTMLARLPKVFGIK
jgi:hypothetical protein